jgi:hypothetical protein
MILQLQGRCLKVDTARIYGVASPPQLLTHTWFHRLALHSFRRRSCKSAKALRKDKPQRSAKGLGAVFSVQCSVCLRLTAYCLLPYPAHSNVGFTALRFIASGGEAAKVLKHYAKTNRKGAQRGWVQCSVFSVQFAYGLLPTTYCLFLLTHTWSFRKPDSQKPLSILFPKFCIFEIRTLTPWIQLLYAKNCTG